MPSYQPGSIIKEIRMRKKLQQELLLRGNFHSEQTISRIENKRQTPRVESLHNFLSEVEMEMDDFFCPYLHGATSYIYQLRNQLLLCLDEPDDANAIDKADEIIKRFERIDGFKSGINLQFLLSCKARFNEIINGDPYVTKDYVERGMAITFPEFNAADFSSEVLIFEESEFLHTYSQMLTRAGYLEYAIDFLNKISVGLEKLPEDDIEREKKLARVLLTLSSSLMKAGDNGRALEICVIGNEASLKYSRGKYTPDFLYNKAICLRRTGRINESNEAFKLAYFGYSLFQKKARADNVKRDAEELSGYKIETYGVDKLEFKPIVYESLVDAEPVKYNNIGEMLRAWRKQMKIPQKDLIRGICDRSYYKKIEANEIKQPSVYILEALAERLGRDHNLYFNTFISPKVFDEKQIRNEILETLLLHEYDKAEKLISILEKSKDYQKGINLQFILNSKASIISRGTNRNSQFFDIIMEAIKITIPDFNENNIRQYHLTHIEKLLVNKLANYYGSNGENARGLGIMERLIESVNDMTVDESEKLRIYGILIYNYSKHLGNLGKRQEELDISNRGIELSVKQRQFTFLPGLYINKGSAAYHLYNKDESMPYFALAFYGSAIVNNKLNERNVADFADNYLKLKFT